MDANQLQELADNARLDHWPPHLGVTTDAEKIEYLAQRLRDAASTAAEVETLVRQNEALQTELDEQRATVDDYKHKMDKIRGLTL